MKDTKVYYSPEFLATLKANIPTSPRFWAIVNNPALLYIWNIIPNHILKEVA